MKNAKYMIYVSFGINRIIMEFKFLIKSFTVASSLRINRIIMEFKSVKFIRFSS